MMRNLKPLFVMVPLWTAATLTVVAQSGNSPEEMKSIKDGVYTEAQAQKGAKVYEEQCLECHTPEEFTGTYMEGWAGRTAHDLLEVIRTTMPENNPGALKRQEFIDIVAYLFQVNGAPAGKVKMNRKSIKQIRIEGPFGKASEDPESKGAEPR